MKMAIDTYSIRMRFVAGKRIRRRLAIHEALERIVAVEFVASSEKEAHQYAELVRAALEATARKLER